MNTAPVTVLGAGSWGTALALLLARNGHPTRLWGHDAAHLANIAAERENRRYLPGAAFPEGLTTEPELARAVAGAALALVVVPSHAYGEVLGRLAPLLEADTAYAWATKGLEAGSGRFLHEVNASLLGERAAAIVSGPSFSREVAAGMPTALTVACADPGHAERVAALLHGRDLRAYTSADVIGVEIGGAVKNVLAIATGISDGLGFGANARAALITRGLAEMVRLGMAVGGTRETFMGLAGIGDLVLTCTDDQSRNRRFGLAVGRGNDAAGAEAAIGQVVEGIGTVREVSRLAARVQVEMPITEQVYRVLHEGLPPRDAVTALLSRDPRPEGA